MRKLLQIKVWKGVIESLILLFPTFSRIFRYKRKFTNLLPAATAAGQPEVSAASVQIQYLVVTERKV